MMIRFLVCHTSEKDYVKNMKIYMLYTSNVDNEQLYTHCFTLNSTYKINGLA